MEESIKQFTKELNPKDAVNTISHIDSHTLLENLLGWVKTSGIKLLIGIIVLWIGWKLVKKVQKVINVIFEKRNIDITLGRFLETLVGIILKFLLIVMVMGYVGLDTSGLAALIASGGIAIGLALQGSLSNFAGGVIILFIRPFNVGDFIEGAGHSGVVEKIGMFYTTIVTIDNKEVLVPNGTLSNVSLTNYTAKETRRVDLKFTVGYEENILKVKKAINEVIAGEKLILNEPAPFVSVDAHGDSAVSFVVRVWVKTENYWTVHFNLLEKVKIKFDEEKISIPYPQMDVHIK